MIKKFIFLMLVSGMVINANAQTLGMVVDQGSNSVVVFDADTDSVVATVPIPILTDPNLLSDCSILSDQSFGFVSNFINGIFVIDLSGPNLAGGINPIPTSISVVDNTISADQQFFAGVRRPSWFSPFHYRH